MESESAAAKSKAVDPDYAQLQAKGAALAAMSREERRAKWPADDPMLKQAPWIRSLLPEISTIRSVTAELYYGDDRYSDVEVPSAHWPELYDLLADSIPVELEAEILVIANFKIVVDDGSSYDGMILSYFANPILFHVETPSGSSGYYATTRSEPEVLAFFHAFQGNKELGKPLGWYPPQ